MAALAKELNVPPMPKNQSVTYRLLNYKKVTRKGRDGRDVMTLETAGVWMLPTFYIIQHPQTGEDVQIYYRKRHVPNKDGELVEVLDDHGIQLRAGTFTVEVGDASRYYMMELSPDNAGNPHRPAGRAPIFERVIEENELDKGLEKVIKVYDAFTKIDAMSPEEVVEVAKALNIETSALDLERKEGKKKFTYEKSDEYKLIRKKLQAIANKTPDAFERMAKDRLRKYLAIVVDAEKYNVIRFDTLNLCWCWKNGATLTPITSAIPNGIDHRSWFASFLSGEENVITLQTMKDLTDTAKGFADAE